jgi:guanine deaminase
MCLGAIHWAKFKKMYFGASKKDVAKIGFDDEFIYDVILGKDIVEQVETVQRDREICLEPMILWEEMEEKTEY